MLEFYYLDVHVEKRKELHLASLVEAFEACLHITRVYKYFIVYGAIHY